MSDPILVRPAIELMCDGRVVPLTTIEQPRDGRPGWFDGGVHDSDGCFCELASVHMAQSEHRPVAAETVNWNSVAPTVGHHVFGGLLNNVHFGHFITESLVRLWAFDHLAPSFRTVVFYRYNCHGGIPAFVAETLGLLIPDIAVTIVTGPARFELLAVPRELKSGSYIHGHTFNRALGRRLVAAAGPAHGAKRIYVSRSRLPISNGGFVSEDLVDDYFRAEGYTVLHPEEMSVLEQVSAYQAAEQLVFADGSALHLYALVTRLDQRVFVIWRRGKYSIYNWQIGTFGGPPVIGESCVDELWAPENAITHATFGRAVLNFSALAEQLHAAGFIVSRSWTGPDDAEVARRLAGIAEKTGQRYIRVPVPS